MRAILCRIIGHHVTQWSVSWRPNSHSEGYCDRCGRLIYHPAAPRRERE